MMVYLIVAGAWFAVLIVFILVLVFAPRPYDGGCIDGADHDWEWAGHMTRVEDGALVHDPRWQCKNCPEIRYGQRGGAGGFGP